MKKRDYLAAGALPVVDQGEEDVGGFTNDQGLRYRGELPVLLFGDHTRRFKLLSKPFAVGADGIKILRPIAAYQPRFAYWAATTRMLPDKGYARHFQYLRKAVFPVPPLPEQRRIVAAIEQHFSRLDAAVATLERIKAKLGQARASVLKAAVEGRLVPTEAAQAAAEGRDYEHASVLLERILAERRKKHDEAQAGAKRKKRYKEPVEPDVEGLPALPEGWVWATVEQTSDADPRALSDGPFGSNLKTAHYTDAGPRVIRLQNIGDGVFRDEYAHITQEHFDTLEKHHILAGDLVVASLGTDLPRACIVPRFVGPALVKADCIRFKPNPEAVFNRYACMALNAPPSRQRVADYIHGVGRPRLGLKVIRSISVPLPPLAEQHRIVAEVDRQLSVLDEVGRLVDINLVRCARLRQAILKRAFEGRLVPQDPNDEPASVLLERIKAQAAATPKKNTRRRSRKGTTA